MSLISAFDSAGQRCSSLRLLYVQADIADRVLAMLTGAMAELAIGDPALLATDVGPVIDEPARARARSPCRPHGRAKAACSTNARCRPAPSTALFSRRAPLRSTARDLLDREVFGPILHVVRWPADRLDQVLDEIDATGYGLTLGIHSRIDETVPPHPRRGCASATATSTAT